MLDVLEASRPFFIRFIRKQLRTHLRSVRACNEQDIEDILSDAYLALIEHSADVIEIENHEGYLVGILRHLCVQYAKDPQRRLCELDPELPGTSNPETDLIEREQPASLQIAICHLLDGPDWKPGMQNLGIVALTEREKQVLMLFLDGQRFKEIAVRLEISQQTVHTHYLRICRKIDATHPVHVVKYGIRQGLIAA